MHNNPECIKHWRKLLILTTTVGSGKHFYLMDKIGCSQIYPEPMGIFICGMNIVRQYTIYSFRSWIETRMISGTQDNRLRVCYIFEWVMAENNTYMDNVNDSRYNQEWKHCLRLIWWILYNWIIFEIYITSTNGSSIYMIS